MGEGAEEQERDASRKRSRCRPRAGARPHRGQRMFVDGRICASGAVRAFRSAIRRPSGLHQGAIRASPPAAAGGNWPAACIVCAMGRRRLPPSAMVRHGVAARWLPATHPRCCAALVQHPIVAASPPPRPPLAPRLLPLSPGRCRAAASQCQTTVRLRPSTGDAPQGWDAASWPTPTPSTPLNILPILRGSLSAHPNLDSRPRKCRCLSVCPYGLPVVQGRSNYAEPPLTLPAPPHASSPLKSASALVPNRCPSSRLNVLNGSTDRPASSPPAAFGSSQARHGRCHYQNSNQSPPCPR